MNVKSILISLILSLFLYTNLSAQEFGGHPSGIKWQNINTPNLRVIFPKGLEKRAYRIASIINHINQNNTYSVGYQSKKIDLILQTNQVISNGFVTLAPYRSEFFGTDLQNPNRLGSLDWLDVLSLHEYRHSLQYTNGRKGFTEFLSAFQGQFGWTFGLHLALPAWYFEGDAVNAETFLSRAGRGRTPAFFKELRANFLSDKDYSYMTARNGSFKRMLPSHYPMGFTIVNYVRNNYGQQVWRNILADAGRYRSVLYPFSGAMQRHTGKRAPEMYHLAYNNLKQQYTKELENIVLIPTENVMPKAKRTVTNYNYPQILNDGSIVAIKDSYKTISHLVHIKDGKETQLCNYGQAPSYFLSEKNGKIAWVELQKDPRRFNRNYTRVVTYDINTHKKQYITSKSKYFSPEFSSKGNQIVVVQANEEMQNNLVIIDANNGKVIKTLPNPKNDFLAFPKWADQDNSIIFLAKRNSQLAILKYKLNTQTTTELTDWTTHTIADIDVVGNTVYYTSSYSGIDNIYSVNTSGDKKITPISSVKIGAYSPTVSKDQKRLIMTEFSDMGNLLTEMNLSKLEKSQQVFSYKEPIDMEKYHIETNKYEHNILNEIPDTTYEVKPYKGFLKGMKLHSWTLGAIEEDPTFSLHFSNILTNLKGSLGGLYSKNENRLNYFGNIIYSKWFVEIGGHVNIRNRNCLDLYNSYYIRANTFREKSYSLSLSVPLNWNKGSFNFSLQPQVAYTYYKTYNYKTIPDARPLKRSFKFRSLESSIVFSATQMKARQNVQTRYGIILSAQYQTSLTSSIKAERINANGSLFLPALMRNHGIKIDANWQKELFNNHFKYIDEFIYTRGYSASPNDEIQKISFNYALPLVYPDWGFGGITYFMRIRANLFYDMSKVSFFNKNIKQNSYGIELFFDNTIFNALPISFGLRESFLLNKDILYPNRTHYFDFMIKIGL